MDVSRIDRIDNFLRENGATNMAIIIYGNISLSRLLDSALVAFIASNFALDKIVRRSGKTLAAIQNTKEFIDIISNNFSRMTLENTSPVFTSVTGTTFGDNIGDLERLDIVAKITDNHTEIYIVNNIITKLAQLDKLAVIRQPGVMGLLNYQNFFNMVDIGGLKGKDLISFCLSNNAVNDMCNKEGVNGENIFHKLIKRDYNRPIPQNISAREYYIELSSGYRLWTFGDEGGHGTDPNTGDPVTLKGFTHVPGFDSVVSVSCGYHHMAIVNSDGSVWTCGSGRNGQLGINVDNQDDFLIDPTVVRYSPIKVPSMSNIKKVSCGAGFTSMLDEFGNVWYCGELGGRSRSYTPIKVTIDNSATDISAGNDQLGILDSNHDVWICDSKSDNPRKFQVLKNVKYIDFAANKIGYKYDILMIDVYGNIAVSSEEGKYVLDTYDIISVVLEPEIGNFLVLRNNIPLEKAVLLASPNLYVLCLSTYGKLYVFNYSFGFHEEVKVNFIVSDITVGPVIIYDERKKKNYIGSSTTYIIDSRGNVYHINTMTYVVKLVDIENMNNVVQMSSGYNVAALLRK